MLTEAIRTLYGHNRWASERVLNAAAQLSPEQLAAPGQAGRGSILGTLVHLISAHRGWLSWWDGSLPPAQAYAAQLNPADYPDLASVRTVWEAVEHQTEVFVAGLTDANLGRLFEYTLPNGFEFRMLLWQMMLHVANHGTQHRSEVAAMLTGFDRSPGDLDLANFVLLGESTRPAG